MYNIIERNQIASKSHLLIGRHAADHIDDAHLLAERVIHTVHDLEVLWQVHLHMSLHPHHSTAIYYNTSNILLQLYWDNWEGQKSASTLIKPACRATRTFARTGTRGDSFPTPARQPPRSASWHQSVHRSGISIRLNKDRCKTSTHHSVIHGTFGNIE